MAAFKKGDVVRVMSVIPEGPVLNMRMDEDGIVQYRIEWTDLAGEVQTRWFDESELEAGQ